MTMGYGEIEFLGMNITKIVHPQSCPVMAERNHCQLILNCNQHYLTFNGIPATMR